MKIAFPVKKDQGMDSELVEKLGRANDFVLYDTKLEKQLCTKSIPDKLAIQKPPALLDELGVDAVVCRSLGSGAVRILNGLGIRVFVGAGSKVKNSLRKWEDDELEKAKDPSSFSCDC